MALKIGISIEVLKSNQGGTTNFYTPISSDQTMLVEIPPHTIEDLFVHKFQSDRLFVVRGNFVLVVLHNKEYQYIPLTQNEPKIVTIPPGIPHSAINLSKKPCFVVNAVLRHGEIHEKDYRPMKPPFPYNLEKVKAALKELNLSEKLAVV